MFESEFIGMLDEEVPAGAALLLHMDGSDGSTSFIDATSRHLVTPNNQVQIDIDQSKFGGASALFDGDGDHLNLDGSTDFAFSNADFTIDFWMRVNDFTSAVQYLYDGRPNGGSGFYVSLGFNTIGKVLFLDSNAATRITGTTVLLVNTWYHVALTKRDGLTRLFLDGSQEGSTFVDGISYLIGASRPAIGVSGNNPLASSFNGWLDEYRVIKNYAAWVANFTPPTNPY